MSEIYKGRVITVPLANEAIDSGIIAILSNEGEYSLCTVQHLTPEGDWFIEYKGIHSLIPPYAKLCTLQAQSIRSDECWPVKLNQWKASIKSGEINSEKIVEFEVVHAKFVEGYYNQICSLCSSSFTAHKRQPLCRECCEKNAVARIVFPQKTKPVKKTKKYEESVVMSAFVAGSMGTQTWESWKDNNL